MSRLRRIDYPIPLASKDYDDRDFELFASIGQVHPARAFSAASKHEKFAHLAFTFVILYFSAQGTMRTWRKS